MTVGGNTGFLPLVEMTKGVVINHNNQARWQRYTSLEYSRTIIIASEYLGNGIRTRDYIPENRSADITVFATKMAIVIGPTPPGTGVM